MRVLVALLLSVAAGCASAPPYARCGGDVACAMGTCTEVSFTRDDGTTAEGTFCSGECRADADCPDDGACIALDHDPTHTFFCVARCDAASDCYAGLACTSVVPPGGAGFGACLP